MLEFGGTFISALYVCPQPRTPLEVEIAGLLKNSEAATVTPEGLTVAEQKALEKMNVEEVFFSLPKLVLQSLNLG